MSVDAQDTEALARVMASEAGGSRYTDDERRAIGWCARHKFTDRGRSLALFLLPPDRQGKGSDGKVRWASTRQDPTATHRALALEVLSADPAADPINGATSFFEPSAQDQLFASGAPQYKSDAAGIRARWTAGGQRLVAVVGHFEFWTSGGGARAGGSGGGLTTSAAGGGGLVGALLGLAGLVYVVRRRGR